jgi:hypothetical protein
MKGFLLVEGVVEVFEVVDVFVKGFFDRLDHLWLAEG